MYILQLKKKKNYTGVPGRLSQWSVELLISRFVGSSPHWVYGLPENKILKTKKKPYRFNHDF